MVSHERTYLEKLRVKGNDDPEATLAHIDTLTQQYPYFQAIHHLGWDIAQEHNLKQEEELKATCSLYTKNRLHLILNPSAHLNDIELATAQVPTQNTAHEVRSFVDWLHQLDGTKATSDNDNRLIDKFISNAPKMVVSKTTEKQPDLTKKQHFDEYTLMTETLAEIYLKQGNHKKAKKAYEILALKYPEKSGFFADQIQKIKNAKNES